MINGIDVKLTKNELNEIVTIMTGQAREITKGSATVFFSFSDWSFASYAPSLSEITVYDRIGHIIAFMFAWEN